MQHHPATDMEELQTTHTNLPDLEGASTIFFLDLGPEDQITRHKDQPTTGPNQILQMTKCLTMTFTCWDDFLLENLKCNSFFFVFFIFENICGCSFVFQTFLRRWVYEGRKKCIEI